MLALALECSGHPQAVGLEGNAFLSHPGLGMPQPSLATPLLDSWSPAGAHGSAREQPRTAHAIDFRERLGGYEFSFSPLEKLFPAAKHLSLGSTKLIKIDFSQSSRSGRRGRGSQTLSF